MLQTTLRHWEMLRLLPRERGKISTAQLASKLEQLGYVVSQRTIQRDLQELSRVFPIACDDGTRPFSWYWSRTAPPFALPGMDVHTALAFRLAADHLVHLLPATTRAYLEPHMQRARAVLAENREGPLASWSDNVLAVPGGLPLQPPVILPEVLEAVHGALLKQRRLVVRYRSRGADQARELELHPLGLVYRDAVAYLVATAWTYEDPRLFLLHRMEQAEVGDQDANPRAGFDLAGFVRQQRQLEFPLSQGELVLEALVEPFLATKLAETPLAPDQRLDLQEDGRFRVTATVHDTVQLRIWLQSQGGYLEVRRPAALRAELAAELRRAVQRYSPEAEADRFPEAEPGNASDLPAAPR